MEALRKIINEELRDMGVIDNGISERLAATIDPIIQVSVRDSVRLYNASEQILAGIMANPNTDDCYNALDVCAESVELADTLLTAVHGRIDAKINDSTAVH